MATPLYDQMSSLITYANEITGASDTRLGDAVRTLAEGYGQGDCVFLRKTFPFSTANVTTTDQTLVTANELSEAGMLYQNEVLTDLWDYVSIKLLSSGETHKINQIILAETMYPAIPYTYSGGGYYGSSLKHPNISSVSYSGSTLNLFNRNTGPAGFIYMNSTHEIHMSLNNSNVVIGSYELYIACSGKKL